jgi:hypothetical protein
VLAGCVASRASLVRELDACAIRVTSTGWDDDTGLEILRADGCGASRFYQCWSPPRSARSCCEPLGTIGRIAALPRCD